MRHLLLVTFIMGLLVVSLLRTSGPDEALVQQIRSMAEGDFIGAPVTTASVHPTATIDGIEKMLVEVQFTEAELERLDSLSQKFPASVSAFHKLCALERLRPQLLDSEYQAVSAKYLGQLQDNRKDSEALLKAVVAANGKDETTVALKQLGYLTAGKLELAAHADGVAAKSGQKLGGALNAAMITTTMRAEHLKDVAPVADVDRPRDTDTD
jgi:hypothetical protein